MVSMAETLNAAVKENGPVTNRDVVNWVRNTTHPLFDTDRFLTTIIDGLPRLLRSKENDKYKHAFTNCRMYQRGIGNVSLVDTLARLKEKYDIASGKNTPKESNDDMLANTLGAYLGLKYPNGDCDEMVQKYISKTY